MELEKNLTLLPDNFTSGLVKQCGGNAQKGMNGKHLFTQGKDDVLIAGRIVDANNKLPTLILIY
jgi:hypothetical protein